MSRRPSARRSGREPRLLAASAPPPSYYTPFAWYRADTVNTATDFDWSDKTGNGHTLRQATGADKPTVVASAVNGQPVIRFDGVSDYLAAVDAAATYTFMIDGTGVEVFALLVPRTALVGGESIIDTYTSGANTSFRMLFGTTATSARFSVLNNAGGFFIDDNATLAYAVGTSVLVNFNHLDPDDYVLRVNGVVGASGAGGMPGTNAPPATLNVGRRPNGSAFSEVDIAEIVIFNRVLSAAERSALQLYFTQRYARP